MNTLNCLVVDDEELARRLVINYCERVPYLNVVGEAANPLIASQLLREHDVDILFLDIQMPEMKGTDLLRTLRHPPAVILTTAYSEYALESYELDVTDYLLKPFSFERFLKAVGKVSESRPGPVSPIYSAPAAAPEKSYQLVKSEHKLFRIAHADILYVESAREYVIYHTATGKTMALGSLKALEESLPANFMRIHKSYIVAKDKVEMLEGNQVKVGAKMLPVGGSYREVVKGTLFEK
ncbi:LytTR family DNA-binding domain-containing protein [Lewinella sp. 4G2]|uniref:LytR/AlgR family response regulator transcription factor n=1 Tax=Lewinella sp. 4G2 TaxID=1803372 RepID=UPI0007B47A7E|nr:LytTR family DNA-binding domain-containing protein [Lewinella sp. 4G2]OAV43702.1 hypothetical protein A3850_003950 [Lewinella sp. 4G2]